MPSETLHLRCVAAFWRSLGLCSCRPSTSWSADRSWSIYAWSWLVSVFDLVVVLGLDVAEEVSDDGTDHGEDDAGNHDSCEEHGFHSKKRPMVSEHLRTKQ